MTDKHAFASDADLGDRLMAAVQAVRAEPISDDVLRRVEQRLLEMAPRATPTCSSHGANPRRSNRSVLRRWMQVPNAALSACLLLAICLYALLFLTPQLTLAQVQSAVAKQKWVLLKYEDGEEYWVSLRDGRRYLKEPGGRVQHFAPGVWQQYLPPGGPIDLPIYGRITESRATAKEISDAPTSHSAWQFLMGQFERIEKARKDSDHPYRMKKTVETVDGQKLVRFDIIHTNALDEEELYAQIWADPRTQLPVRSRKRRARSRVDLGTGEFVDGIYSFPESGPKDIYDLGVPSDAKIVRTNYDAGELEIANGQSVVKLLAEAEKFRDKFPGQYRIVMWPADLTGNSIDEIDVMYYNGNPVQKKSGKYSHRDWTGVKVRQARYGSGFGNLPLPADVPQVLDWAAEQAPLSLYVSDGKRTLVQHNRDEVRVRKISSGRLSTITFPKSCWPSFFYWRHVGMGGRKELVTEPPEAIDGTVLLRIDFETTRLDFYIAPERDHLCVKEVWWRRHQDDWREDREYELFDFRKLPGGQWWAAKQRLRSHNDPLPGKNVYEQVLKIDISTMNEGNFPHDAFDTKVVLEQARKAGAKIIAD